MVQPLSNHAGDMIIQGSLTVLGGLNEKSSMKNTTEVASTQQQISDLVTQLVAQGTLGGAGPSNNATDLLISSENNTDGSFNLNLTWKLVQGPSPADGVLIFYKSDLDAPDPIDVAKDPSVFIAASAGLTEYGHTFAAMSSSYGGVGAIPRHYRFGIVAVSIRPGGAIPHSDGIVENPSWIDATFAMAVSSGDDTGGNSINIISGILKSLSGTTELDLSGNGFTVDDGDTHYGSLGLLAGIGRLLFEGGSAPVTEVGDWTYNGTFGSSTTRITVPAATIVRSIPMPNGSVLVLYVGSNFHIYEVVVSAAGSWGSAVDTGMTTGTGSSDLYYALGACLNYDNKAMVAFLHYDSLAGERLYYGLRSPSGTWSAAAVSATKGYNDDVASKYDLSMSVGYSHSVSAICLSKTAAQYINGYLREYLYNGSTNTWTWANGSVSTGLGNGGAGLVLIPLGSTNYSLILCGSSDSQPASWVGRYTRTGAATYAYTANIAGSPAGGNLSFNQAITGEAVKRPDGKVQVVFSLAPVTVDTCVIKSIVYTGTTPAAMTQLSASNYQKVGFFILNGSALYITIKTKSGTSLLTLNDTSTASNIPTGTVFGQIGAGVIEFGFVSGQGYYAKIKIGGGKGILIQWFVDTRSLNFTSSYGGGYYATDVWNYPVAFDSIIFASGNYKPASRLGIGSQSSGSTTGMTFYVFDPSATSSGSGVSTSCRYFAIGLYAE